MIKNFSLPIFLGRTTWKCGFHISIPCVLFSLQTADYTSSLFFKIVNSVEKVGLYITSRLLFDRPLTSQGCII